MPVIVHSHGIAARYISSWPGVLPMMAEPDRLKSGTVSITSEYLFLLREDQGADESNAER